MTPLTTSPDETLPSVLPAWSADIEVAAFDSEFVVYDLHGTTHRLVGLGAVVFSACDGTTTVDDLADEVTEVLLAEEGIDPELVERTRSGQVRDDVTACLRQFGGLGFLDGIAGDRPPPCGSCGDSAALPSVRRRKRRLPFGR